MLQLQAIKS